MKTKIILLLFVVSICITSCQHDASHTQKDMVKVTILYPNGDGKTFDMDYYANKHMPMVANLLGESLKGLHIDTGISGRTPDDPIPYLAIGYLYFDTLAEYQEAFAPHAEEIVSDIPNYTNTQPLIQISKIVE